MLNRKYLILSIGTLGLLFVLAFVTSYQVRDVFFVILYDLRHSDVDVKEEAEIDRILENFESRAHSQLPEAYLSETQSNIAPYRGMLAGRSYYLVPPGDVYKKIVGPFRIRDFMPKDKYYRSNTLRRKRKIIWLMDKRVLKKLLQLKQHLAKADFDEDAFHVVNGYRHPAYNAKVGGASKSRHILGQAIDISVADIDKNGRIEKKDKAIVLDLLEKKVIRSFGGLGLYPKTRTVHLDVRGYRARWNSY